MAGQLSQEDLQNFQEFTGASYDKAVIFLKNAANNSLEAAIDDYFTNPDKYQGQQPLDEGWNESVFHQDRQGEPSQHETSLSFQVDYGHNTSYPHSTAPTRPPSRASHNGAALNAKTVDGQDASGLSQQETGVIGGSGTYFGPPTKTEYDTRQWALTVTNTSAQEYIPDVDPEYRNRLAGEPAFMKPLATGDYLPSLITILSTIPLVQQAILLDAPKLSDYGYDANWWSGTPITVSEAVDLDNERSTDPGLELIYELQRLLAFLKRTDRSYGSVEALSNLEALKQADAYGQTVKTQVDRLLIAWEGAATQLSPELDPDFFQQLFRSYAVEKRGDGINKESFWCLEIRLHDLAVHASGSLYDAMDALIWRNDPDGTKDCDAYIDQTAQVLIMRVIQPNASVTGLNLRIPVTLYVDRYTQRNMAKAKAIRKDMARCAAEISRIEQSQNRLRSYKHPRTGKLEDATVLLETLISAFKKPSATNGLDNGFEEDDDSFDDAQMKEDHNEARETGIIHQLQAVYGELKQKIQALDEEKAQIHANLKHFSDLLKEPSTPSDRDTKTEYSLCGVSTDPHTTYALFPEPLESNETSDSGTTTKQWWRLIYTNAPTIIKEKVTEADVLKAAEEEYREVMLVYASEAAMLPRTIELPEPLKAFVDRDNLAFTEELAIETNSVPVDWTDLIDPPAYEPPPGDAWEPDMAGEKAAGGYASGQALAQQDVEQSRSSESAQMQEKQGSSLVAKMASGGGPIHSDMVMEDVPLEDMHREESPGRQHIEFADDPKRV